MTKRAEKYGVDGDIIKTALNLGMENYAKKMLRGYKTFFIFNNGGYVKKAKLANPGKANINNNGKWEATDELGAAQRAATAGHKVYFLPRVQLYKIRDPDIILNNNIADIKHIFKPVESAIKSALRSAKDKGATAVLMEIVTPQLTRDNVEIFIKRHIGTRLKYVVVNQGGNTYTVVK